ncbi:MAG: response regulator transcription factor [Chloroflexi bacterium]|nr:response regulator transcription factor [Chloroflexota bacterium]
MDDSSPSLLIADHDQQERQRLRGRLEEEGFLVEEAADAHCLLAKVQQEVPDLIVLDIELPPIGGLELCQRIKRCCGVPVVVLTALDDEDTKLKALDLYAEDYILKPASYAEVAARIRRILRRTWLPRLSVSSTLHVDDRLHLNFRQREVRTPEGVFRLTPLEARLLQLLIRNAGRVLPTGLLLEQLWDDRPASPGSLWEYVRRVRRKIGDDRTRPRYIVSEPGLGYRFSRSFPAAREEA